MERCLEQPYTGISCEIFLMFLLFTDMYTVTVSDVVSGVE